VVSDPDRYAAQILARFFFSSLVTFRLRLARARRDAHRGCGLSIKQALAWFCACSCRFTRGVAVTLTPDLIRGYRSVIVQLSHHTYFPDIHRLNLRSGLGSLLQFARVHAMLSFFSDARRATV
jgi:hypothetical protein